MTAADRLDGETRRRVHSLVTRYALGPVEEHRLATLLLLLSGDPLAPTAIRDPLRVADDHLADSLVALELERVRTAQRIVDIGSGAGAPALPLAVALPAAAFVLVESSARKCAFLERATRRCELGNVEVVHSRVELYGTAKARFDTATVRAVAALDVVAEYAAPLLAVGGALVAWHGKHDPQVETRARRAAQKLGLSGLERLPVHPYPAAHARNLYLMSKVMDTPERFPRRPGVAAKRPLGGEGSTDTPDASTPSS